LIISNPARSDKGNRMLLARNLQCPDLPCESLAGFGAELAGDRVITRRITWSILVPGAAPSVVAGELLVSAWLRTRVGE
jgi:hypothetical protein